jgi:hydrogenase-4 component B
MLWDTGELSRHPCRNDQRAQLEKARRLISVAVGILGLLVLALAVECRSGKVLSTAALQELASAAVTNMHVGPLLVPATGAPIRVPGTFAFISLTLLVIMMPLLALLPLIPNPDDRDL